MSWEYIDLRELYAVHNGLSKGSKFFGSGFPFLSFSTVFNNWFLPKKLHDLVQSTDKEQQSYSIMRGDVFITRTSETMDELGMSSVALKDYPYATYNGFTKRLRPINPERILPEFIGYYLRTPSFRASFTAFSTMTTRASLRNEDLLSMKVPVPDMRIQRRIASILSAYDDLIENNQKQIKLLEEAAQRLYKEWFVDMHFPGWEDTQIVDGVPEGWLRTAVTDLLEINYGKDHKELEDGSVPVYGSGGLMRKVNKILHSGESVLIPRIGTLNNILLVRGNFWTINTMFFGVPRQPNVAKYVYFFLLCVDMYAMNNGAAVPRMSVKILNGLKLLLPTAEVLKQFEKSTEPLFSMIELLKKENESLTNARDLLLPKLMNGEIEVE